MEFFETFGQVSALFPVPVRAHDENAVSGETRREYCKEALPLVFRQRAGRAAVEADLSLCVDLVDVLAARPTRAHETYLELLAWNHNLPARLFHTDN